MLISRMITGLMGIPGLWDLVQVSLGAPRFKRELYLSRLHPPGRLLDFGCANGHLADAFDAFEYYAVDLCDFLQLPLAKAAAVASVANGGRASGVPATSSITTAILLGPPAPL